MSNFSGRLGFAIVLAAMCLGGRGAHAQASPLSYWTPGWPVGFGNATVQNLDNYGNFPGFNSSDGDGFSYTRYNFQNGWFVGNEGGNLGLAMNGLGQSGAFGGLRYEGVQFGYNFQNGSPITLYGGFDTLKYDPGIGAAFGPFDSTSSTVGGYGAHAGIEYRPTSNLSLSVGASFTQQSNRIDSNSNAPLGADASPFALVGHH